jgi:hypothetical protein
LPSIRFQSMTHSLASMWGTNNDPRANVPTGGRVAWSQPLAGRPTMAEGERPHRGFLFALKMRPTTTPVASTSKSSSFHSPDGWLARCAFRISEDMELACCNASARSTALSEPNDELSVITTNRSVSFPESAAPPPCSKGGGISLTQKCGRQTNAESEISFKRTSKTVAALV